VPGVVDVEYLEPKEDGYRRQEQRQAAKLLRVPAQEAKGKNDALIALPETQGSTTKATQGGTAMLRAGRPGKEAGSLCVEK